MKPWMRVSVKHPEDDSYAPYNAEEVVLYPPFVVVSDVGGVVRIRPLKEEEEEDPHE